MTAAILSFGRRKPHSIPLPSKMPWQNQDLAELYRVRDRLCAAGLNVEVEGGVSDEGDPWFVYQQAGTDNVVVHIARIDHEIHVVNCVTGNAYVGQSFREVSDQMLEDAPLALGSRLHRSSNVVLHPSAFLTAFVAAAIMLVDLIQHGRAEAAEGTDASSHPHGAHAMGEGAHLHLIEGGGHHEAAAHEAGEAAQGEDDGTAHRRLGKDGPVATSGASPQAGAPAPMSAPLQAAGVGHGGYLVDLPGSGSSFALTAGMFAAELLRVFASEEAAGQSGPGFASDVSALFTAFVSGDAPQIREPAAADVSNFSLATGTADIGESDPAVSARIDAPSLSGEGLAQAFSVRAAAEALPEVTVFTATDLQKAPVLPDKTMPAPAAVTPVSSPAAPASSSGEIATTAAAALHTAEAATPSAPAPVSASAASASTPASASTAPITATAVSAAQPTASASVVATLKDAASDLDLGWVVSQLVKRGTPVIETALKLGAAVSASDAAAKTSTAATKVESTKLDVAKADVAKSDTGKTDVKTDAAKLDVADGAAGKVVSTAPSLDAPASGEKHAVADKVASGALAAGTAVETNVGKALDAAPLKPVAAPVAPVDIQTGHDGLAGKLVAGRAETIHYAGGSNLTIEGFVFGEDVLSFADAVSDRLSKATQDGSDLVLGDADTGLVRLVGVLGDPAVLTHHGAASAAS